MIWIYRLTMVFFMLSTVGCVEAQNSNQQLNEAGYREFKSVVDETDKSPANDVWNGSIYRNKKYGFRVQFPEGWEVDKGMSTNTVARAIHREYGITLSAAIQHLPVVVDDKMDILKLYPKEEFKSLMNEVLAKTNKSSIKELDIQQGYLNNLPAYIITATYDLSSMDQTMTFIMRQVQCLRNSKFYNVQMVIPLDFYDDATEQLFRSFVDSYKFEYPDH